MKKIYNSLLRCLEKVEYDTSRYPENKEYYIDDTIANTTRIIVKFYLKGYQHKLTYYFDQSFQPFDPEWFFKYEHDKTSIEDVRKSKKCG